MSFEFTPFESPFPGWHGPYSPARGTDGGFRVRDGRLMTVVTTEDGQAEWVVEQSAGTQSLQNLVGHHWGGGRVLLLPNGLVVKPSPHGNGERWVIGQFHGPVVLQRPDGTDFNMADPGLLEPGDLWPGPGTTGVECVLDRRNGSLHARIRIPTPTGFLRTSHAVIESDELLARGFAIARPSDNGGRVRVTANGHVITNRFRHGQWECVYIGLIDVVAWSHLDEWAEGVELAPPYQLEFDPFDDEPEDIEEEDALDEAGEDSTDSFADAPSDGDDCDSDDATRDEESGEGTTADSFFERLDENEAPYEDDEYDEEFIEEDEENEEEAEEDHDQDDGGLPAMPVLPNVPVSQPAPPSAASPAQPSPQTPEPTPDYIAKAMNAWASERGGKPAASARSASLQRGFWAWLVDIVKGN